MKKLFNMTIVLAFLAMIIKIGFNYFVGGHTISYEISSDNQVFKIVESFSSGYKSPYRNVKDKSNFLFEVYLQNANEPLFVFKLIGNYNFYQRLITDIKYFEDNNYKCIYPVLKIKNYQNDVICFDGVNLVYYNSIKGQNAGIDDFVNKLYNKYKYTNLGWFDIDDNAKTIGNIEVYEKNINKNHILALWNYTGLRTITKTDSFTSALLLKDVYDNKLGTLVGKYYITPNYSKVHSFNKFIVLDITTNSKKEILLLKEISIDSYIQGVVDNKLYLYDKSNKIQYQIDPYDKTCIEIGDSEDGIRFYDGNWSVVSIYDIANDKKFEIQHEVPDKLKSYNYNRIDNVNGDKDGYYYIYVNFNNKIRVYRVDKQKIEYKIYLFETDKISNIKYLDDYIYFIKEDTIYVFHETLGLKPVVKSFELLFNKLNVYDVYSKW